MPYNINTKAYAWTVNAPSWVHTNKGTSRDLVPAGAQRLEEAEAVDGDQSSRVQDT